MWKKILLIILILGCDPMATKYNNYSVTDPNPEEILSAIDMDCKGLLQVSLTEWDTTAKPNVAQESIIENGGARFKTDATGGDVISLIDPTTGITVVDGLVYIVIDSSGNYFFTATTPTWNDEKQGWYGTASEIGFRYLPFSMTKNGTLYENKNIMPVCKNLSPKILSTGRTITPEGKYAFASDDTTRSKVSSATYTDETNLNLSVTVCKDDVVFVQIFGSSPASGPDGSGYRDFNTAIKIVLDSGSATEISASNESYLGLTVNETTGISHELPWSCMGMWKATENGTLVFRNQYKQILSSPSISARMSRRKAIATIL